MRSHRTLTRAGLGLVLALGLWARPTHADKTYTVCAGDCIWAIAERLDLSPQALLAANDLAESSIIRPGQRLRLPEAGAGKAEASSESQPEPRRHVVRKGESLSVIGRRYGVSVGALATTNRIRNRNRIYPGQRLVIPSAHSIAERLGAQGEAEEDFVSTALRYRGVPYRYAGMTSRGMDCSGLVARVLRLHGIDAPHSSRALYKLGKPISGKDLQAGDLVFFRTRGSGISHVGIYIGDGKFVHASSREGKVTTDRIDRGYYQQRLVGARRIK